MNSHLEDLLWTYKGLIETMISMPGMYGLDEKRSKIHKEIEAYFVEREEILKEVLHNLEVDMQPTDIIWAVNNIEKFRNDAKRSGRYYAR